MITRISINSKTIEYDVIEIESCSMSDPTFSDKMKCPRSELPLRQVGGINACLAG